MMTGGRNNGAAMQWLIGDGGWPKVEEGRSSQASPFNCQASPFTCQGAKVRGWSGAKVQGSRQASSTG